VRNTITEAVIEAASSRSNIKLGTGINITKTMLIAVTGSRNICSFFIDIPFFS